GWSISGRKISTHAGRGTIALCGRHEMGHPALPGHEPAIGSERSGMNAHENFRLPLRGAELYNHWICNSRMCEKFWTLPSASLRSKSSRKECSTTSKTDGFRAIHQSCPRPCCSKEEDSDRCNRA